MSILETDPGTTTRVPPRYDVEPGAALTTREREIIALKCEDLPMAEIASRLGISPRTVETYVHHILGKTGKRSMLGVCVQWATEGAKA